MTHEFDRVRAAFAASTPARIFMPVAALLRSAWRSSRAGLAARSLSGLHESVQIRIVGVAVAIAAAMQPLLIWMMPRTVKPAMPWWVFVIVAVFAAMAAWRPAPFGEAWHHSRVRRWSRSLTRS